MKQIIQSYKTGEMKLEEVPCPQIAPGMVLVETKASLVSAGTEKMLVDLAKKSLLGKAKARPDLVKKVIGTAKKEGFVNTFQKVRSKLDTPIPLGYSCAGIVKGVGEGVDGFQVGDRVACGGAGYANHAGFNVVPKNLCVRIPETLKDIPEKQIFEEAASATVGAIALQGVRQAELTLGERVCVIGLGLLGQITVQLCKANGCRVIGADIDPAKIELAKKMGADEAVHSSKLEKMIQGFTEGAGADAVIITAAAHGNELISQAGDISRIKGRVVVVGLVGLDIPRDVYYKKELDIRLSMSYGPGRYDVEYEERGNDYPLPFVRWTEQRNMQTILELIASGKLNVKELITHRFPFEKALEAYNMIVSGSEPYLGVVLEYAASIEPERIILRGSDKKTADKIGLGVIGAGNFAKGVLLPRFAKRPEVEFEGVVTARGMSAKAVGDQFGFKYCADNNEAIYGDESVNSVLIATRHNLHGQEVINALNAGKNVFVEKPLCLKIHELKTITDLYGDIAKKGTPPEVMVGFNRRFSPFIEKIKAAIQDRITPLVASYRVNAGFIPKDSWVQDINEGGGRILGEICHFVDLLRFLVGSSVRTVQAASVQDSDKNAIDRDSVSITLTYTDGSLANILYHAVGNPDYPKEILEVSADGAVLVMDDFRQLEIFGKKHEKIKGGQNKGFDAEIDAFIAAVSKGGGSPIPFTEIVETTLVAFAIHSSMDTGQIIHLADFAAESGVSL